MLIKFNEAIFIDLKVKRKAWPLTVPATTVLMPKEEPVNLG